RKQRGTYRYTLLTSFPSVMNRRLSLDAHEQSWPLDEPFRIARGTRKEARVVVVTISDGQHIGRGEAVPLARYNQSAASVLAQIKSMKSVPRLDRQQIQHLLPAEAARSALLHTIQTMLWHCPNWASN